MAIVAAVMLRGSIFVKGDKTRKRYRNRSRPELLSPVYSPVKLYRVGANASRTVGLKIVGKWRVWLRNSEGSCEYVAGKVCRTSLHLLVSWA